MKGAGVFLKMGVKEERKDLGGCQNAEIHVHQ